MARVERFTSTTRVPIERAQLIDPSAFRFSTASAEAFKAIGGVLEELGRRKIEMQDRIGLSNVNAIMENAEREYQEEIIGKPLEEHTAILQKHRNNAMTLAGQQRLSPEARAIAENKLPIWGDAFADAGEIATIKAIERDAIIRVTADYEKALTEGNREDIIETEIALDEQFKGSYEPAEAKILKEKAEQRAIKQMEQNAVNAVHEAIEVATDPRTGTGDFTLARELVKSELIPEPKQTSLRTTIGTAEKVRNNRIKEDRQQLIDETTSKTIREYFGEDLTVATLNERHEKGLIKDSEFKFMMKGLAQTVPERSDPFAAGRIRRSKTDFDMGLINRAAAEKIALENYPELDADARENIVADLEDIEEKIIATAKSNAYSEGRGLMSVQFVGISSQDDFVRLVLDTPGLTEEEKKRINRRWEAELSNRDLYERAVDDRFKEMRKAKISAPTQFKSESLEILLQYQRRKRLTLEELEREVSVEQQKIISKSTKTTIVKPVGKMTTIEKQKELERIRELKRLVR